MHPITLGLHFGLFVEVPMLILIIIEGIGYVLISKFTVTNPDVPDKTSSKKSAIQVLLQDSTPTN